VMSSLITSSGSPPPSVMPVEPSGVRVEVIG
jgi:hypothetical protein